MTREMRRGSGVAGRARKRAVFVSYCDVRPIAVKFSKENPFGAPVEMKGDLGRVGGGIPVVAFWTREVGEAIGHVETLPLVLSIPVETTKDGRVAAGVRFSANATLKPG